MLFELMSLCDQALCGGMEGNTNKCVPRRKIFINTLFKGWLIIFKILHVYTM